MVPETQPERGVKHILVVDDEAPIRAALCEKLRDAGLYVIEAVHADEAWSYLASGAPVDLLFSDVRMPGSMDGAELARRVRERYPAILIILSSGSLHSGNAPRVGRFLSKPYRHERAVDLVLEMLGIDSLDGS